MTVFVKQQQRQQLSHLQQHVWQVCLMGLSWEQQCCWQVQLGNKQYGFTVQQGRGCRIGLVCLLGVCISEPSCSCA